MLLIWGTIQARITGYEKKVLFFISHVANQGVEGLTCPDSYMGSAAELVLSLWSQGFVRALIRVFLPPLINWLISTFWKWCLEVIFLSSSFRLYSLKFFHFQSSLENTRLESFVWTAPPWHMILSWNSLWQVNPLIEIMWGILLLNSEDLLGERRLQTINYMVFIASWHVTCSYVLRQSCGPQWEVENQLCSCWPTENFIL